MPDQHSTLSGKALILVMRALGALPLSLRRFLGRVGGTLFAKLPTRERRIAALQYECVFGERPSQRFLADVFSHIGMQSLEAMGLTPFTRDDTSLVQCNDWQYIHEVLNSNRGLVALTAHTGNWDLVGAYMVSRGIPVTTVARPGRSPAVHQALAYMRSRYGIDTIWRTGPASARTILKVLAQRGVVAALIDQDTDVASTMIPFFGLPASTPSGIVDLAHRTGAAVCSVFSRRRADGSYLISVTPFDDSLSEEQVLKEFNTRLEDWIRIDPAQWVWFHKRWRTLQNGERLSTKRYLERLRMRPHGGEL
ncbi:MAG: hypothetical protein QY326_09535 [Bdellovibrionota bacterium]|nr:MAG: hypothetical protein QY326_09535 [Bdellovibrionota bacterium]